MIALCVYTKNKIFSFGYNVGHVERHLCSVTENKKNMWRERERERGRQSTKKRKRRVEKARARTIK